MKNRRDRFTTAMIVLAGIAFAGSVASAQINIEAEITITNSGSPQATRTLMFGLNPAATLGIDAEQGEDAFPPFPPTAVFEARFVSNGGSELGEGSPADIRPYTSASQKDEYKIKFQPGTNGLPLTISWDMSYLKSHYSKVTMKDPFGGVIMSVDMLAGSSAQVTNPALTELVIEAEGPKDPSTGVEDETKGEAGALNLQNMPNPVSNVATVSYTLSVPSDVTLRVINADGEVVARILEKEKREEGRREERIDMTSLPAGTYLLSLEADGKMSTTSVLVVR